jgi:hypothetical protein
LSSPSSAPERGPPHFERNRNMKRLSALPAALLVALLLGASTARADFYSNWSYTLGLSTSPTFSSPSGNVSVSFGVGSNSTGVSDIPVGNLSSNSSTASLSSLTGDQVNSTYVLTIGVNDGSGASHNFQWQGVITGTADTTGDSTLNNTFTGQSTTTPGQFGGPLSESATLGTHVFTVTIDPTTSPPGTNAINAPNGATVLVDAGVSVSNVSTGGSTGGVSTTPEPSALVLAGCAVSLVGLRRWRKGAAARLA